MLCNKSITSTAYYKKNDKNANVEAITQFVTDLNKYRV